MLLTLFTISTLPLAVRIMSGSQALLIAVILATTFLMLLSYSRKRRETGPSPRAYAREQMARLKEEKVIHDDLSDLMMQLERVAREMNGELDAKFIRLEKSIRDADARAERLERLLDSERGNSGLDVTVGAVSRRASSDTANRDRIYALADAGRSAKDIASETDIPVGEVKLTLSLRKTRKKSSLSVTV